MVYDIYSTRIATAQQNIAVLSRILDGTWDSTDLFEFEIFLRVRSKKQRMERSVFIERVCTKTMTGVQIAEIETLISDEHLNLRDAQEQHRRDVVSGVRY
jgi:hypothetical protein